VPLLRYAKVGPELLEMADEGLALAARAKARLGKSLSAAQHAAGPCRWWGWAMAAHQHAPFLERRASAHAGGGALVAASRPFFFALTRELDISDVLGSSP
jgi:hypothetical protein